MKNITIDGVEYTPVVESEKIHIGDVVLLRGRSWPVMTVLNEPQNIDAICTWFLEDMRVLQESFPVEALVKAPKS